MSRTLTIALLLSIAAPLAHAQDGELVAALDPSALVATDASETYVEDEEYIEDEEYAEDDLEYCGGGPMSAVDIAWDQMEYGDENVAHRGLVDALRSGGVEAWERARGITLLAELQLRRGEPGRAIVNFRRAERLEPGVTDSSRVALATALYLRGQRRAAREEAQTAHDEQCADRYATAACYGANLVLSRTAGDEDTRRAALEAASTLRDANPDLADAFDAIDAQVAGS